MISPEQRTPDVIQSAVEDTVPMVKQKVQEKLNMARPPEERKEALILLARNLPPQLIQMIDVPLPTLDEPSGVATFERHFQLGGKRLRTSDAGARIGTAARRREVVRENCISRRQRKRMRCRPIKGAFEMHSGIDLPARRNCDPHAE